MKLLLRIVVGVVLLAIVALGAALLALPRLLDGESVRGRIQQAARDSLGRELSYETLEFGFLPPSLKVMETTLSGEKASDPPLLEARQIALRVALLPLLTRTVVVDSLVVDGAVVRLTRGKEGLELPTPPDDAEGRAAEAGRGEADSESDATADADSEDSGVDLAVSGLRLTDSTVHLVDRSVSPAVSWELREIDATARGRSLDGPIAIDAEATLASGGGFTLKGTASRSGELDLGVELDDLVIDPLASYLEADFEFGGRLGGTAKISGPAEHLEKLELDLHGEDVRFDRGDLRVRGTVDVQADIADPNGAANGSFELDATQAQLTVGGGFTKPPGTAASVTGRIAAAKGGGLAFDDVRLRIKNFEATGRVSSLDPLRAEANAAPFDLAGWEEILPALAESRPSGRMGLNGLVLQAEPPSVRGRLELDGVVLRRADSPEIALSGALRGEGDGVVSEDLVLLSGDQTLNLDARLESLFGEPRYDLGVRADGADSNSLLTSIASKPDTLFGPLGLDARFQGPLGGDLLSSLGGRIDFNVADGRLVGVSLLRAVFDRLGAIGAIALDLGKVLGGRDLQQFYGDEFQLLRGVLDLEGGVARTEDLTLLYKGYGVRLSGTLGLADLTVDMRGELTIHEELDAQLAKEFGSKDSYQPRKRAVEVAAVRGTLDDPTVKVSLREVAKFAAAYGSGGILDQVIGDAVGDAVGEEAGEILGGEAGRVVEGILDGILGGGRQQEPSPLPEPGSPAPE